jgi:PAS domain S-box-containing protein
MRALTTHYTTAPLQPFDHDRGIPTKHRGAGAASANDSAYRMLAEAIADVAIYLLDPTGLVENWNPGAERFTGYRESEILGQHFSRFHTDEDRQSGQPERALLKAEIHGKFENEGWRLRKDGTRFWAQVAIDPIRDADGHLLGFAEIVRDVTDRKQAETALRRSEDQFNFLVQGATDCAIYMLDLTGRVTNWNAGAERIQGYLPRQILGRNFSCFYTDEDRALEAPQAALDIAAKTGRFDGDGWRVRADGSRFPAHVVIDPVRNELGGIVGFAKVTRDLTTERDLQV